MDKQVRATAQRCLNKELDKLNTEGGSTYKNWANNTLMKELFITLKIIIKTDVSNPSHKDENSIFITLFKV